MRGIVFTKQPDARSKTAYGVSNFVAASKKKLAAAQPCDAPRDPYKEVRDCMKAYKKVVAQGPLVD